MTAPKSRVGRCDNVTCRYNTIVIIIITIIIVTVNKRLWADRQHLTQKKPTIGGRDCSRKNTATNLAVTIITRAITGAAIVRILLSGVTPFYNDRYRYNYCAVIFAPEMFPCFSMRVHDLGHLCCSLFTRSKKSFCDRIDPFNFSYPSVCSKIAMKYSWVTCVEWHISGFKMFYSFRETRSSLTEGMTLTSINA